MGGGGGGYFHFLILKCLMKSILIVKLICFSTIWVWQDHTFKVSVSATQLYQRNYSGLPQFPFAFPCITSSVPFSSATTGLRLQWCL